METREMIQKITAMERQGLLKGLTVTFRWGSSNREYTLSDFRYEYDTVHFRQDTDTGEDCYANNSLNNINDWFMSYLLKNLLRVKPIDRNLF